VDFDATHDGHELPEFSPEVHPPRPPYRDEQGRLSGGNPGNSGGKKGRSGRPSRKARIREMVEKLRRKQADS
jgi:hypothetical protein